jgi:hypothetical protein
VEEKKGIHSLGETTDNAVLRESRAVETAMGSDEEVIILDSNCPRVIGLPAHPGWSLHYLSPSLFSSSVNGIPLLLFISILKNVTPSLLRLNFSG